ncbi:carbohydrate binding family 9 domain-containing protein [Shewanella sp. 202IG2-18]|uniref:carbohydrate binding family 9 domain-containing protein n=1 Tax=Parashewanella hymeniacidonis TaxID=2807618 RepID=UPI001961B126|nr:carbohydrate binding family 9 domain-containing protein [Parashewanella hymeniacidonis]MBM7072384.1 carbohydrate binding family 9 domain-containing protein [Parashewanella hymeniacidonis]
MKKTLSLFTAFYSSFFSSVALAGVSQQQNIQIPTLTQAANIDGAIDEPQWNNAAEVTLNFETRPRENIAAPVTTKAKIYATKDSIFVAFKAFDPNPDQIRANLRDRDNSWGDDTVGIRFDTYNDSKLAYNFFVNAYGAQADSIENELTGQESDAWDGIWYSAGKKTDDGFHVEMELPISMFVFDDSLDMQTWGIDFIRYYPRSEVVRIANNKIDRNINCNLCQIGTATGLSGVSQGSGIQITPSLVASRQSERDLYPNTPWENETEVEPGLDFRWSITPSTLLNATINPDFSQVEADAGQLDVNTTFALYFPEKRPFFLDNKDYFDTQRNLLHTRNIAAPDYGVKVTSKVDQHTSALLITQDSETNFLIPGNLGSEVASLDDKSTNIAARYRYDATEKLAIGTLITAKQSEGYHNYLVSGDLKYQPSNQDTFRVQAALSQTEYPEYLRDNIDCDIRDCESYLRTNIDDDFTGNYYRLNYSHDTRNWNAFATYESYSDDFRADLGFIERVDFNKFVSGGGYSWFYDQGFFNEIRLSGDWDITHNDKNELLEKEAQAEIRFWGKYQSFVRFMVFDRNRVGLRQTAGDIDQIKQNAQLSIDNETTLFEETFYLFDLEFDPIPNLSLAINVNYGDEIDFTNNQLGKNLRIRPSLEWDILDNLAMEVTHNYKRLNVEQGRLFTANLTDLRLNWQFSVKSFIRFSSVYRDIDRNLENYKAEFRPSNKNTQRISNEVLYGYKLNPLSVFYLGYSDNSRANDQIDSLTPNERRIFMKISYAFVI